MAEKDYISVSNRDEEDVDNLVLTSDAIEANLKAQGLRFDYSMPHKRNEVTLSSKKREEGAFRIVVQRVNSASLLVDNVEKYESIGRGLVVYVSFAKHAQTKDCERVAKNILHLPILTAGKWGDGSKVKSVASFCKEGVRMDVMVIPQAGLISKYKKKGKSLQYHHQMGRKEGKIMYDTLCKCLEKCSVEAIVSKASRRNGKGHAARSSAVAKERVDLCPPSELFRSGRFEGRYSTWDERGFPTRTATGEELTKSAMKKLIKIYKAHVKRYQSAQKKKKSETASKRPVSKNAGTSDSAATVVEMNDISLKSSSKSVSSVSAGPSYAPTHLDDAEAKLLPRLVFGTFGNRQALRFSSEMGPFTHTFLF